MSEIVDILKEVDPNNFGLMMNALNKAENLAIDPTKKIKISFLRNVTIEPIEPYLKFHMYKACFKLECIFGDYDTVEQEVLSDAYLISEHQPDIIVWSLYYHMNNLFVSDHVYEEVERIFDLLREKTQALILINTLIPPFDASFNTNENEATATTSSYLKINQMIRQYVQKHSSRFCLMDWERYVRLLGENASIDYRYWYMHRSPFKSKFLNLYAQDISKVVRALKGKAKKCLVLDCDNTLWGGIIGEDGLHGIKLDNQEYPGKMFYDFQQYVLSLISKGVIIALCSKNNAEDVWNVIENHPYSLIKKEHVVAARINWDNKASNIMSLSKELNLGLDSFVFVDDNPMECELVRSVLPDVEVLMVPSELYHYPQLLPKAGLFDTLAMSQEDTDRTLMYQQERTRKSAAEKYEDLDSYLQSLQLELIISKVNNNDLARVAQLTQKTNQFNLSTIRYSEQDIQMLTESEDSVIFSLVAKDRFGNYGLTGVLIGKRSESIGVIDSFLLSCRILSRKIEYAFMSHCLNFLNNEWDVTTWQANFLPTGKNHQVEKFLMEFGFTKSNTHEHFYQIPKLPNYQIIEYIKIAEDSLS